jgi:hypothetical protein
MGEPIPGDIADPVRLLTTQVSIVTNLVVSKGDWLVKDGTNDWFTKPSETAVGEVTNTPEGLVQAQEDADSTGIASGSLAVACFEPQSRVYAFVGADLNPGENVSLQILVDDSPGPAVVGFGTVTAEAPVGRFVKISGDTVAKESTTIGQVGIIDLGAGAA